MIVVEHVLVGVALAIILLLLNNCLDSLLGRLLDIDNFGLWLDSLLRRRLRYRLRYRLRWILDLNTIPSGLLTHIGRVFGQIAVPVVVLAVLIAFRTLHFKRVSLIAPDMTSTPRSVLADQFHWTLLIPVMVSATWPMLALHRPRTISRNFRPTLIPGSRKRAALFKYGLRLSFLQTLSVKRVCQKHLFEMIKLGWNPCLALLFVSPVHLSNR
jgi:hypothetical protein